MNAKPDDRLSLLPWIAIATMLITAALFAVVMYHKYEIDLVRNEKKEDIRAIADLNMASVQQFRKSLLTDIWSMSIGPFFKQALIEWMRNPKIETLPEGMRDRLEFRIREADYSDAALFDTDGNVIASATGKSEPLGPPQKKAFDEAVASGFPTLSQLYIDNNHTISIDAVAPVKDSERQVIAVVLLRRNAESQLFPLLQVWPNRRGSRETLLVSRDDDDVLFLSDLRYRANSALSLRLPLSDTSDASVQAVLGEQGFFDGLDYRGIRVLADLRPIPDSPWFMVTKIDESEVLTEAGYRSMVMGIFSVFMSIIVVGLTAYMYRIRQARTYRNLYRSERERRKTEGRYFSLFENMLEGLAHCQMIFENGEPRDFIYLEVNEAFGRLTGLKDVIGRRVTEVIPGVTDSNPELFEIYGRVTVTGNPEKFETYVSQLGIWFSLSVYSPQRDHFIAVFENITERKLVEKKLKLREETLHLFIEHAPTALAMFDQEMSYLAVSRRWMKDYGLGDRDIIGAFHYEIFPEIEDRWKEAHRKGLNGEVVKADEDYFCRADGSTQWLSWEIRPWYTPDDTIGGIIIFTEDVSQRREAEEAVRKSEAFFRAVFEQAAVGVALIDSINGRFIRINQRYCDIVGYTREEMERLTFQEITHPDDIETDITNMTLLLNGNIHESSVEKRYFHKDGFVIWVNLTISPMWKQGDRPDFHIAVVEDITERKRAEEALRESENEKSMILESAAEMFAYYDLDLRVRWMNKAAYDAVGFKTESAIGQHCYRIWQDSNNPCENCPVIMCRDTGVPQEAEKTTPDGRIWFLRGYPVRDGQGNIVGLLEFIQDITGKKMAEMAIEQSEKKYRATFHTAAVGIDLVDLEGRFLEANGALCEFLGYTPDELKQMTILDVTYPDDVSKTWDLHESLVSGKISEYRLEKRYVQKDGNLVWADMSVAAILGPSGEFLNTVGVIRDITKLKETEEARGRLTTAVDQASETIMMTDASGAIVYVNPSFEKVTGYSYEEAIGQNPRILKSGKHDHQFYRKIWKTISRGDTWKGHLINRRKDGTLFEEDASISPVRDGSDKITNYVAVKRDVSREMSLLHQLQQSQKIEAIGTLASGIAHDFNNILQIVLGFSDLVLFDNGLSQTHRDNIAKIKEAAKRGADLVHGLLAFGRKSEFKPQPLDMNRHIISLGQMLERMISKGIVTELELEQNLYVINADPTAMNQILMNLALNARDAMPEGGKLKFKTANITLDEVYASEHVDIKPGRYVLLTVSDTGSGIDPVTLEHVFEPFFTTKAVGEGTGLGLAVVHGIVKQHHGDISCESNLGMGTAFKIYFPALEFETRPDEPITETSESLGGTETILIVDDEEMVRGFLVRVLTNAGYKVIEASNGLEALQTYQSKNREIDLVLLDLMMPIMGGTECLDKLKKISPSIKVVIASGYTVDESLIKATTGGANASIKKPYSVSAVLKVIREVLDK